MYLRSRASNMAKMQPTDQANGPAEAAASLSFAAGARAGTPLFRQIYARVRDAILAGELREGARLPSVRLLAAQLPASRTTVQAAYDLLAAEGLVTGRGAAGTVVGPVSPASRLPTPERPAPAGVIPGIELGAAPRPFQMGLPAIDQFPRKVWCRLAAQAARGLTDASIVYQDPGGDPALRQAIVAYLAVARGVTCTAAQVIVTSGFLGALALVAAALLRPGDKVWVEDPGYFIARQLLELAGLVPVPVPVDAEGIDVDAGIARAPDARLVVVTPTHQFPLGMTLSLRRRLALVEWARSSGARIVEDDYDSEYRYLGRPPQALGGLDEHGRVLHVGTFSKVLFPSLRLGYLVAPPAEAERLLRARFLLGGHASALDQAILCLLMRSGGFSRHIGRMRRLYAARRTALASALERHAGDLGRVEMAAGGMHLLLRLPDGSDDVAMAAAAWKHGLAARALSSLALQAGAGRALLLGFASLPEASADAAASRLRAALTEAPASPIA